MSIGIANIKQVFGLRANVSNCIGYQDDASIVYPAGSNIVMYHIDSSSQRFIPNTDKSTGLTTMCVSQNKRYIAIAEKLSDKPIISIYDLHTLRKRKVLTITDTQSTEVIGVSFSPDSKHLITQTGAPDWTLYYWSWEKSKIMAFAKICANLTPNASVTQVEKSNYSFFRIIVIKILIKKLLLFLIKIDFI